MQYLAVVFDMDGLLLDSERIALDAFVRACEQLGVKADLLAYNKCIGTNSARSRAILSASWGTDIPCDQVFDLYDKLYLEQTMEYPVPVKPGAVELIARLRDRQIPLAVATSTDYQNAVRKLTNAELLKYFEFVIGGDQVRNGKPHPEIYRKAVRKLGLDSKSCLALEDSDPGVRAARAAGLDVIQIPDLAAVRDSGIREHVVLPSLYQVPAYLGLA